MSEEQVENSRPANISAQSGSVARPWRVWPAVLLIAVMGVAKLLPSWVEDGPAQLWMVAAFGPLLCGFLMMIWWLTASRARWWERVLGVLVIAMAAAATIALAHPSMRGPAMMMLTVPMGLFLFGVGAIASRRLVTPRRILVPLAMATVGFGISTLLRSDGVWGEFAVGLDWRWKQSSEERLLMSKRDPATGDALETANGELAQALAQPEWPAFRGADRTSRQRGSKVSADWQKTPPQLLWKIPVGPAWSSFAVAGDWLFTQEQRGPMEVVVCYHADDGREVWVREVESRFDDPLGGPGPRATPTLDNGKLYAMGAQGFLLRLDARTGEIEWKQDLRQVAKREPPMWGFSSSPLVTQGVVIVHAGSPGELGILAFDAETGEPRWSAPCGEHSYGSAQPCEIEGEPLIAMLSNLGLMILEPATGKVRLDYDWKSQGYRACQPQWIDGDSMLIPTGMGSGTRRVRIKKQDESFATEEVWTSRNFKPDFNDFVFYQGHLYGFDGAIFSCLDFESGERRWKGGRYGKGQVLLLEDSGLLLVISEQGELVLLNADPAASVERARLQALEGKTWNHPVVVGDRLFLRNAQEAVCYRLPR
ncbi:MAG: hypothetical protein RIS70_2689, partial [Planctomycetota bacterium]